MFGLEDGPCLSSMFAKTHWISEAWLAKPPTPSVEAVRNTTPVNTLAVNNATHTTQHTQRNTLPANNATHCR